MSKGGLASIEARPKLHVTTESTNKWEHFGAEIFGDAFAKDISKHDVAIAILVQGRTFILEQLVENATTPLEWGGETAEGLKNNREKMEANNLGNLLDMSPLILLSPEAPLLALE